VVYVLADNGWLHEYHWSSNNPTAGFVPTGHVREGIASFTSAITIYTDEPAIRLYLQKWDGQITEVWSSRLIYSPEKPIWAAVGQQQQRISGVVAPDNTKISTAFQYGSNQGWLTVFYTNQEGQLVESVSFFFLLGYPTQNLSLYLAQHRETSGAWRIERDIILV
jgi:hypothetical protein